MWYYKKAEEDVDFFKEKEESHILTGDVDLKDFPSAVGFAQSSEQTNVESVVEEEVSETKEEDESAVEVAERPEEGDDDGGGDDEDEDVDDGLDDNYGYEDLSVFGFDELDAHALEFVEERVTKRLCMYVASNLNDRLSTIDIALVSNVNVNGNDIILIPDELTESVCACLTELPKALSSKMAKRLAWAGTLLLKCDDKEMKFVRNLYKKSDNVAEYMVMLDNAFDRILVWTSLFVVTHLINGTIDSNIEKMVVLTSASSRGWWSRT